MNVAVPQAPAAHDDWRDELRREYAQALPGKYARIERRLIELAGSPGDPALLQALFDDVHRLHGTAGSYGFPDLSRLAGEWEVQLLELRDARRAPCAAALARMEAHLAALRGLDAPAPAPRKDAQSPAGRPDESTA